MTVLKGTLLLKTLTLVRFFKCFLNKYFMVTKDYLFNQKYSKVVIL